MGYYSDIYISTTNTGYARMRELAEEVPAGMPWQLLGCGAEPGWEDVAPEGTVFGWECMKWYPDFPEVRHIHSVLDRADAEGIPWQFIRIGEEPDDIEELCSDAFAWDSLSIRRMDVKVDAAW